jgi:hypothetical protein
MSQTQLEEQLNKLYRISENEDEQSNASISMVIDIIEDRFAARDLQAVNEYLGSLDVKRASPRVLVCSLRCSFRAKFHLPNWHYLMDATFTELEAQGLDAKRMLRGMF